MQFQIYWSNWWQLCPSYSKVPDTEIGYADHYLTWSIFQFHWYS